MTGRAIPAKVGGGMVQACGRCSLFRKVAVACGSGLRPFLAFTDSFVFNMPDRESECALVVALPAVEALH